VALTANFFDGGNDLLVRAGSVVRAANDRRDWFFAPLMSRHFQTGAEPVRADCASAGNRYWPGDAALDIRC